MAFPPVAVFVGGAQLEGYTALTITRSKEELTGTCSIDLFFNYMPSSPVVVDAAISKEVLIYIGGQLAFTGFLDRRTGSGIRHGQPGSSRSDSDSAQVSDRSVRIGPNEYNVSLTARGKTKKLIKNSHMRTTDYNFLQPTTRDAIQKLVEPFDVQIEWLGTEIELDKLRLRDGAKVVEELRRIATENSYYIYETRDGKLRVTDDIGPGQGDALILGQNILMFSANQSEEQVQSEITVKGQRTKKDVWGKDAVVNATVKIIRDDWAPTYAPVVVQHYGDATQEALERRGRFEANKRSSLSKQVTIEVFHVMAQGQPWDVGQLHYVEIPPEGIFDVFECTGLTYTVTNGNELKTTLTLSPPPKGASGGAGGLESFAGAESDMTANGASQKAALGVTFAPGTYPAPWTGPVLVPQVKSEFSEILEQTSGLAGLEIAASLDSPNTPPLQLPGIYDV
jgi:prophage tail gpP-like protein